MQAAAVAPDVNRQQTIMQQQICQGRERRAECMQ
jgi:hypothetical protein